MEDQITLNIMMTKFTQVKKFYIPVLVAFLAILSSCGKTTTDTPVGYIRFVNASPTLSTYNTYLTGTRLNSVAIPYAGTISYTAHSPGSYDVMYTTASAYQSLLTKTVTLSQGVYSSFYLLGRSGQLEGLLIADDLSTGTADKAYIRFVNLCSDAQALDLAKKSTTTAFITSKTYKSASSFAAIDAGSYEFDVRDASGNVKASLSSTAFAAGYHYEIICGGLVTPANDTEKAINVQAFVIK